VNLTSAYFCQTHSALIVLFTDGDLVLRDHVNSRKRPGIRAYMAPGVSVGRLSRTRF